MSILEQYKRSKQLWIITALVLVLTVCIGVFAWLWTSRPASAPHDESGSPPVSDPQPASPSEEASLPLPLTSPPSEGPEASSSAAASPSQMTSAQPSARPSSSRTSAQPVVRPPSSQTATIRPSVTPDASTVQILNVGYAGVHDAEGSYGSITVSADGVSLENKTVTGDLLISPAVRNGTVELKNLVVKGKIIVEGGSDIYLEDVTCAELISKRSSGVTDYTIVGKSTVNQLRARNHLTIDESHLDADYDGVRSVTVEKGAPIWQNVTLTDGEIDTVTVNESANIIVERGAKVVQINANAKTHIGGSGTVSLLQVADDNVSYEKEPRDVDVKDGYADPVQQSWSVGESEPTVDDDDDDIDSTVILPTPSDLSIESAAAGSVQLGFSEVSKASGYRIVYSVTNSNDAAGVTEIAADVSASPLVVSHPLLGKAGTEIRFTVQALGSGRYHNSGVSAAKTAAVRQLAAPAAPSVSYGSGDDAGKLIVRFAADADATGYELRITKNGAEYAVVTEGFVESGGEVTLIHEAPADEGAYAFSLRTLGNGSLLADSDYGVQALQAVLRLAVPTGTLTLADGEAVLALTEVSGASDYRVWLVPDGGPETELTAEDGSNGLVYKAKELAAGSYGFAARAESSIDGVLSSEKTAVTDGAETPAAQRFTVVQQTAPAADSIALSAASGTLTVTLPENAAASASYDLPDADSPAALALTAGSGSSYTAEVAAVNGSRLTVTAHYPARTDDAVKTIYLASENTVKTADTVQLAAPDDVTAAAEDGEAALSFGETANASGYTVGYRIADGAAFAPLDINDFVLSGGVYSYEGVPIPLSGGDSLTLRVTALGDGVFTVDSDTADSAALAVVQLDAPADFAIAEADGETTLTFTADPELAYVVTYRPAGGAADETIAAAPYTVAGEVEYFTVAASRAADGDTAYLDAPVKTVSKLASPPQMTLVSGLLAVPSNADTAGFTVQYSVDGAAWLDAATAQGGYTIPSDAVSVRVTANGRIDGDRIYLTSKTTEMAIETLGTPASFEIDAGDAATVLAFGAVQNASFYEVSYYSGGVQSAPFTYSGTDGNGFTLSGEELSFTAPAGAESFTVTVKGSDTDTAFRLPSDTVTVAKFAKPEITVADYDGTIAELTVEILMTAPAGVTPMYTVTFSDGGSDYTLTGKTAEELLAVTAADFGETPPDLAAMMTVAVTVEAQTANGVRYLASVPSDAADIAAV